MTGSRSKANASGVEYAAPCSIGVSLPITTSSGPAAIARPAPTRRSGAPSRPRSTARKTLPPFLGRPESAIKGAYVAELIVAF
ncbi:hypothetical protein G5C66_20800 [Nocardioides sp. KC13]|uniref:Uncharacterized protein n=1 Tax=Nocardioides turkmenicus TaxID=2711220 RepID=A0A6M1QYT8_9ACTN|nr:hypothetical protein [Nocardioides sp. KC13]NGN95163.1 hypothetical protein [Nocardioides sp. KC13]